MKNKKYKVELNEIERDILMDTLNYNLITYSKDFDTYGKKPLEDLFKKLNNLKPEPSLFYDLENEDFVDYIKEYIEAGGEKISIEDLDGETLQELWIEFKGGINE